MWIFVLLVIAVLCISLFDFFVSRTWHNVTYGEDGQQSEKLRLRHKRANAIRKTYNRLMLVIVSCMVIFIGLSLYTQTIIGNMYPSELAKVPDYDTTQMSLEAPPMEDVSTVPENYKIEGNAGIDQEAQAQQKKSEGEEDPRKEDAKEQSQPERTQKADPNKLPDNVVNGLSRKDFDSQEDFDKYKKSQEQYTEMMNRRAANKKKQDEIDAAEKLKRAQQGDKKPDPNKTSSSKSGTADVEWNKSQRKAFQNNDDNVRTPKYTCPGGVAGKVSVKVKINSSGSVISATSLSNATDPCLVEQAVSYARTKSRFEASSKELEELTLTYTFYP